MRKNYSIDIILTMLLSQFTAWHSQEKKVEVKNHWIMFFAGNNPGAIIVLLTSRKNWSLSYNFAKAHTDNLKIKKNWGWNSKRSPRVLDNTQNLFKRKRNVTNENRLFYRRKQEKTNVS